MWPWNTTRTYLPVSSLSNLLCVCTKYDGHICRCNEQCLRCKGLYGHTANAPYSSIREQQPAGCKHVWCPTSFYLILLEGVRGFLWRYYYVALKEAMVFAQADFRRRLCQQHIHRQRRYVVVLQCAIRHKLSSNLYTRSKLSIRVMQTGTKVFTLHSSFSVIRAHYARKKHLLLAPLSSGLAHKLQALPFIVIEKAAVSMQAQWRMHVVRQRWLRFRAASCLLQTVAKKRIAQRAFLQLFGMSVTSPQSHSYSFSLSPPTIQRKVRLLSPLPPAVPPDETEDTVPPPLPPLPISTRSKTIKSEVEAPKGPTISVPAEGSAELRKEFLMYKRQLETTQQELQSALAELRDTSKRKEVEIHRSIQEQRQALVRQKEEQQQRIQQALEDIRQQSIEQQNNSFEHHVEKIERRMHEPQDITDSVMTGGGYSPDLEYLYKELAGLKDMLATLADHAPRSSHSARSATKSPAEGTSNISTGHDRTESPAATKELRYRERPMVGYPIRRVRYESDELLLPTETPLLPTTDSHLNITHTKRKSVSKLSPHFAFVFPKGSDE